ncbi:MAG: polysaccharide biosynthesis protein, partial [Acetatifactor sp.]|nr:polysaccharide biosynthesis protein [Acetatifactor sp.]
MSDKTRAKRSTTKDSIMMQASVLVIAGFISKIIGLLYRSPLHGIIGKLGFGYYSTAYNFYTIVLLISSYSIPGAISKVIAQKLAVKEYRNAHRIFLCSLGYVLVVGGVASAFLFFGAGLLVDRDTVPVLRTLAPTVFVYGILGVLRGYFQAHKSMVQTSVSQILEQLVNAVVSVAAAYLLIKYTMGTMEYPQDLAGQVKRATHGAMGSALGTGAGVLIALLFMLAVYGVNRGLIHRRIDRDRHEHIDSYGEILKMITMVVTPFILNTAVYNLRLTVNNEIYTKFFPDLMGVDSVTVSSKWGVFSTAQIISDIPLALAAAIGTSVIPAIAQLVAAGKRKEVKEKITTVIKSTMVLSIPCAVGIFVLGKPLTGFLFPTTLPEDLQMAGRALMALSLSIVFCELSTLNSNVLQG